MCISGLFAKGEHRHGFRGAVRADEGQAALTAEQLLGAADFASIGTNDLSQYTMAADRMQGELAPLLSVWQPAVLAMIRAAAEGGRAAGKPVGVASLSMAPSKIGPAQARDAAHDLL